MVKYYPNYQIIIVIIDSTIKWTISSKSLKICICKKVPKLTDHGTNFKEFIIDDLSNFQ